MPKSYFPATQIWKVEFPFLPSDLEQMRTLPQATLDQPWKTAALTAAALCVWPTAQDMATDMLNWLRGPRPLTAYDIQFIRDRLRGKDYLPRSYFSGATPENNYTPVQPLAVTVIETAHSNDQGAEGYITLYTVSHCVGITRLRYHHIRRRHNGFYGLSRRADGRCHCADAFGWRLHRSGANLSGAVR